MKASVTGTVETVYDYSSQKCDDTDIPDMPARAYRDREGNVVFMASHYTSRRAVGPTLASVAHQCPVTYSPHNDISQSSYRYHEWLWAPYTLDGSTVYAIAHSEWYGALTGQSCAPGADWVNALTLAVSHDGGAAFTQPTDYLVRYPVTPWSSSFSCTNIRPTRYGDYQGSNIVAKDGYYYRLFDYVPEPGSTAKTGACLMRTSSLADASSWEVWNGNGYTRSKTSTCAPVDNFAFSPSGLDWLPGSASLTYNTYLQSYVSLVGGVGSGTYHDRVYFQTSRDLIHWSDPVGIEGTSFSSKFAYPSLLDPTDTSRNFENTGETPYLYLTRFNNGTSGLDRDIMRVQIKFSLPSPPPPPPPLVNHTPVGWLDSVINGVARGWTIDPDASSTPLMVKFYVDGPAGTGTYLGSSETDRLRLDINIKYRIEGDHGYYFTLPSSVTAGAVHSVYAYGVDSMTGEEALLTGAPLFTQ